ncbi:metal binding domain of Ada-domain-containing protein [Aspergillus pseudonomiae]|uniref:Metal binding domain of Ada-domain-containing protein n=1 Tax=Aspergillus pseudonomiae TaxID=1506151 RepID=A0A5N6IHP6_9EURO|nr:metal binding domain of Ada-domain-containing protein [Aspergillus pseudonomiae]KAB8266291.1 metal binding domain of Ada-domain-containing protein [Aspergillus pseudonomiae]KAE8404446.1 metal binding domain of Ada-domain-containing protein [Aspergillus pseudonomiae]
METQPPSVSPDLFQTSHSRWLAITHRAPSSHSSFLYGVKSTKIYCRPTCAARIARRANVVFYDTADQARRDGFRPCKRCEPDNPSFLGGKEEVVARVITLLRIKKDEVAMKQGLKELAQEVGVTPSYLCRAFKKTMGVTVGAYIMEFEREIRQGETDSSTVQSTQTHGLDMLDVGAGLLTPAITAMNSPAPVDGLKGGMVEGGVETVEENLDLNFNLDEWFWTKDFLNDSIYGRAIQGSLR